MTVIKALIFLAPIISWGLSMMALNTRDHLLVKKHKGYGLFARNDGAGVVHIDWKSKNLTEAFIRERSHVIRPYKIAALATSIALIADVVIIIIVGAN